METRFARSSRDEDGLLLHVLAARRGIERAAEIGSGAGVGTAWIAAALAPGVPLFTAEREPLLARGVAALFSDDPDVHVLEGDWRDVLPPHAPFDFVFVDAGRAKDDVEAVLAIATPGATLVLDDFSADWDEPDPRRAAWLGHPRLSAIEVGTGTHERIIVAVLAR